MSVGKIGNMGLQLNSISFKQTGEPSNTSLESKCPVCNCMVEENLYKHIQESHSLDLLKDCIAKDFDTGLKDIETKPHNNISNKENSWVLIGIWKKIRKRY